MPSTSFSQDTDLAKYFTDVEPLRAWFEQAVASETLPKRLLVIWGVGGIGKSSLLGMFRLHCREQKIPVGLASGDEAKSAVDVLARWAQDLKNDGANLPTFFKTYENYREIQAKVEDQAKATNKKLGDAAVKGAGKVAEAGAAAAVGAVVGSVIPGIGTVAGAVGGIGAEALVDYLRSFLSKPDIDLLLDPSKKLTEDFLADVNELASKRRVVLMLDTYEQMTALDDWTRDVAQRLNENILLVIAGRAMVNWGRQWSSWLMHAEVQELKPMTKRVMHELIRKYYKTMRPGSEPNPKQVNAIIEFSGGLPMVVNTAVQLWVKYGVEDFGMVKGEVVREVVKRLREGVPPELYPLLETAAALRYFNKDILRTVSGMGDISAGYEELLRFPFVRRRAEGYALHDRVRDMIEENVRTDDPAKYRAVHERAAAYFEARIANATGEEAERLGLERLYHRVCVDEESGMRLFQEMAEELVRYRLINRLRALLNDVNTYPLESENSRLWREYYSGRLMHLSGQWGDAETVYKKIGENKDVEPKLRAYALRDWGAALRNKRQLEKSIEVVQTSLSLIQIDSKLANGYFDLAVAYRRKGDLANCLESLQKAVEFYTRNQDKHGLIISLNVLKTNALWHGNIREGLKYKNLILNELSEIKPQPPSLRIQFLSDWAIFWAWFGRLNDPEREIREALQIAADQNWNDVIGMNRDLGYILAMQDRHLEANECFARVHNELVKTGRDKYTPDLAITLGFEGAVLMKQGNIENAEQTLLKSLELKSDSLSASGEKDQEVCLWLGQLYEISSQRRGSDSRSLMSAQSFYKDVLNLRTVERLHFECNAVTGLTRVKHAQREYSAIPPLLVEAEQLAQQYEYNDHLASLRLTQGHIAWEGKTFEVFGDPEGLSAFDAAFEFYKLALVYALRYNRFLLDEVLSGRPQGTPLRPIIPECLKRGDEGTKMLRALSDRWQTGKNDVGTPRPDTISPIPENITLLEAERIAREREPGNGSAQKRVVEQIETALKQF